ncbi:c-type cytochrome [Dyadobacter sp. 676]|uniref:C-type cytochrome n=1 Tax=Dyadobacter sp. 676 TaxID=3088362 RepID=A0AAU8FUQ1_9BACT
MESTRILAKKAPVGLGFAPAMMTYDLGSTALAGLVYYTGMQYPAKYRNSFFTGDVVTCRIDRNTVTFNGSTPSSKKEEPFLVSKDPWFRPVDIKVGPDGALYIADFYNRIIGHYEVALNHPGRDRVSGRIWKVTYKGAEPHHNLPVTDWATATIDQLLEGLKHPQLNTRLKVADRLVDTWKEKAVGPVRAVLTAKAPDPTSYVHALWILHRLAALDDGLLGNALEHREQVIKIHALRILNERGALSEAHYRRVTSALKSNDPFIQRTAAEVLMHFPRPENLPLLMDLYEKTPETDSHLRYTALLGIRNNLKNTSVMWRLPAMHWNDRQLELLNRALLDVESPAGASFVLHYTLTHDPAPKDLLNNLEYIGRLAAPYQIEKVIDLIDAKFGSEPDKQLSLYRTIQAGIRQSGALPSPKMVAWGQRLAGKFLNDISEETETWKIRKAARNADPVNSWMVSERFLVDVMPPFRIILSEKGGYGPQSALYSVPFRLPETLKMNVFDNDVHNRPERTGVSKNSVKIRLADSEKVVGAYRSNHTAPMEYKDLIRKATFDLSGYAGQMGYIEVVDSSRTGSVGIGQFEPAVVSIPEKGPSVISEQRIAAAEIAGEYRIGALQPALRAVLRAKWMDFTVRNAAAGALMNIDSKGNVDVLADVFNDPAELPVLREKLAVTMGQAASPSVYETLKRQLASGARNLQIAIASVLANTSEGIGYLLNAFRDEELGTDIASEIAVQERLTHNADASQRAQMEQLLAAGANERAERQKLIDARIANFKPATTFSDAGKVVFVQNCSGCHQIQGSGGLVGPQLDGIGNWGHKALTQKILDPNRNITEAFRTYNITLKNNQTLTGLYRRTEGETMVFADMGGREFSVAKGDMKEYRASRYTLMPDQFRNIIPEKDFYALLDYLLGVK